jgi:hypothetical protein
MNVFKVYWSSIKLLGLISILALRSYMYRDSPDDGNLVSETRDQYEYVFKQLT